MTTSFTENSRVSDVLLFEAGEEFSFTRDQITVVSGTLACAIGQVLGKITIGAITAAAPVGTGNGTCTLLTTGATAKVGAYTVKFSSATAFTVTDPNGVQLTNGVNGAYTDSQINFTITAGGTAFVAGDTITITVAAGSGKWSQVTPAAVDGTQNAAGVLIGGAFTATLGADATAVAVTRGPAILKLNGLVWTSGMSSPQKTAALAQLQALGIPNRSDLGV
jgi:head decoration protein D